MRDAMTGCLTSFGMTGPWGGIWEEEKARVIPMRPPAGGQAARDLRIGKPFITPGWWPDFSG